MIRVAEEGEKPLENAASDRELYEILREHIGQTMLIRRKEIERVGVLQRISFHRKGFREQERIVFGFSGEDSEMKIVNKLHHIEVKIDGIWKILNPGSDYNEGL